MSYSIDAFLSDVIKKRRKILNLTQKEVAEKLSISTHQLQKYENGLNKLSSEKLLQLSEVLAFHLPTLLCEYDMHRTGQLAEGSLIVGKDFQEDDMNFHQEAMKLITQIHHPHMQNKVLVLLKMMQIELMNSDQELDTDTTAD